MGINIHGIRVEYFYAVLKDGSLIVDQYITKMKIHSSCEIEDFVETHLCKLCVILRSRVLRVGYPY